MGTDWVSCRMQPGADPSEVRRLANVATALSPHGRFRLRPNPAPSEEWRAADSALRRLLDIDFGRGGLGRESYSTADLASIGMVRVQVFVSNPTFPPEWRDEAVSVILPGDLGGMLSRWQGFRGETEGGEWAGYQFDLYLYERATDPFDLQQVTDLCRLADMSLGRSNAWAAKPRLVEAREDILQSDLARRWVEACESVPVPYFDPDRRHEPVADRQRAVDRDFHAMRDEAARLLVSWNRSVPKRWKLAFPQKGSFEDHMEQARNPWLLSFFRWCGVLVGNGSGLYLWT